jgi:hypothetical protein
MMARPALLVSTRLWCDGSFDSNLSTVAEGGDC